MKLYQIAVYVKTIRINKRVNNFRFKAVINNIHFETDANKNMYKVYNNSVDYLGKAKTKTEFIKQISCIIGK